MTGYLPKDAAGHPIQAVPLKAGSHQAVSITGTSARTSTDFDDPTNADQGNTRLIRVWADVPTHIRTGDSSVTATTDDPLLRADTVEYLPLPVGHDRIAGIKLTGGDDGNLYVCLTI